MSIRRVLIANRGEIAVRVIKSCQALGIETIVTVSEADRASLAAQLADRAVCIGSSPACASYLNQNAIMAAALALDVDAVHPGYGFLAENAAFAALCEDNGVTFVGPRSATVRAMGNKLAARATAQRLGVPIVPGSLSVSRFEEASDVFAKTGFPALFKAAAGGGGRGIRIVRDASELRSAFESSRAEAESAFGEGTVYVERYVTNARHVEVQIFGDRHGHSLHFGERDCSMQRRYQKIVEEAPAVFVPDEVRDSMRGSAVDLALGIGYENAGTIEFIYDVDRGTYYFLEMNTRIQVEHPTTEEVTGVDLVQLQFQVAAGEPLSMRQADVRLCGHAIECRITAESPADGFRPSPGEITAWQPPGGAGVRLDSHCYTGYRVPAYYDSLLGKLITYGNDRAEALTRMRDALRSFEVDGVETNIDFLSFVVSEDDFARGSFNTRWIEEHIEAFDSATARRGSR